MTAPNTNVEKQAKRHRGPLVGIVVVIVFAIIMAFVWAGGDDLTDDDAQDGTAEVQDSLESPGTETVQELADDAADGAIAEEN